MAKKEEKTKVSEASSNVKAAEDFFGAVMTEQTTSVPETGESAGGDVENESKWLNGNFEGQLAVDVYQTDDSVVIQSTLAGVRVDDIDISVNSDMVTIRGIRRHEQNVESQHYFYQECYWGGFSRSIILPFDVKGDKVNATLKNGILTVVLPKANKAHAKSIKVHEEPDDDAS